MASKTTPTRGIPYDTETIMTQVTHCGFVYRTKRNGALLNVLIRAGLLKPDDNQRGRYIKKS